MLLHWYLLKLFYFKVFLVRPYNEFFQSAYCFKGSSGVPFTAALCFLSPSAFQLMLDGAQSI